MNSEVNFYNLGRNIEEILRKIVRKNTSPRTLPSLPGAVEEGR